jgi:hypothetical protein
MIPGVIVDFLGRATVAMGGTRDSALVPHVHRVSGWTIEPDLQTITCLIGSQTVNGLIQSLEDNGQFALTVCEMPSHETYQFKGRFVESRPVGEADIATFRQCRDRFVERISAILGYPAEKVRRYGTEPSIAVRFKVKEIFVQTPGPTAGKRLMPREE